MTNQCHIRDLMSASRRRVAMTIQQFSLARNDYVISLAGIDYMLGVTRDLAADRAALDEARAGLHVCAATPDVKEAAW
jgi:hypothetical protein